MIKRIKADRHAPELKQLAGLLPETIGTKYGPEVLPDTIIPVPLHCFKQLRRGFNQSYGIAQQLSLKLPQCTIDNHSLKRTGYGRAQHLQDKQQRLRSMLEAFCVN